MQHYKNAIITISIGNRPWIQNTAELLKNYALKVNADFFIESEIDEYLKKNISITNKKRPNILAYATKSFVVWKYLEIYDKVLVIDDTCCISPLTPNIFDVVPNNLIGGVKEPSHNTKCFNFLKEKQVDIEYNRDNYANSGVIVYPKEARMYFSPGNIIKHQYLLGCRYPHQALTYYIIQSNKLDLYRLPYSYNYLPGLDILSNDERKCLKNPYNFLDRKKYIYHYTGVYRNRKEIIAETYNQLKNFKEK